MSLQLVWESLKTPARQVLLALYAFGINWIINFVGAKLGFIVTEEQKALVLSWGTPIVWWILSWVDRIMHNVGKARDESSTARVQAESLLTKGISRF